MSRSLRSFAAATFIGLGVAACVPGGAPPPNQQLRTLEVFGPYRGAEADSFAVTIEPFEERTGIDVRYIGSANFVADLTQRVSSGVEAPDIALIPQRGLVDQFIEQDTVQQLAGATVAALQENYPAALLDLSDTPDSAPLHAVPFRQTIKSIVWYRPAVFAEFGWSVPESLDELTSLVDTVQSETGIAPWCFSIASGLATGWPATDWIEDLVLRLGGPDVYDEWVDGAREFDDSVVREAMTVFDEMVITAGRSHGDLRTVMQVDVQRTHTPLLASSPGCAMYKQANFALSWMPGDIDVGPQGDIDFFVLPGTDPNVLAPLVVGGDNAVRFSDSADARALMEYLATPQGAEGWAARGGFITGLDTVTPSDFYRETDQRFAELLLEGRTLRFDGSDAMSPAVGSQLIWSSMTAWIEGSKSLDDIVAELDSARDPDT